LSKHPKCFVIRIEPNRHKKDEDWFVMKKVRTFLTTDELVQHVERITLWNAWDYFYVAADTYVGLLERPRFICNHPYVNYAEHFCISCQGNVKYE
jgi:hypothetical protein